MQRPDPSFQHLPRRRFLAGLGSAAAAAAFLAACNDDGDETPAPATATGTPVPRGTTTATATATPEATPAVAADFPRTVPQHNGSVEIPERPERVVALTNWDLDFLVSLDIEPVAAVLPVPLFAWLAGNPLVAGLEVIQRPESGELPVEAVAATLPDLLVDTNGAFTGYPGTRDETATLQQIAPTLSSPANPVADGWRDRLRQVGRGLGLEDLAEARIAEADAAIARVRSEHPEFAGKTATFAVVPAPGAVVLIVGEQDFTRQFMSELGFVPPPAQVELVRERGDAGGTLVTISYEEMQLLDADVVVIGLGTMALLVNEPTFQAVPAVQRGAAVSLDFSTSFAGRAPSPVNIPFFIENVVPELARALGST